MSASSKGVAVLLCLGVLFLASGCQNAKSRMGEGAAIGAVIGAAAGGIIGHQSGSGGEGAAIGGIVGALGGAAAGSQMKKQAAVNPDQMSLQEVAGLVMEGIDEDVIIDKIRRTRSGFDLGPKDINYLQQRGVSQKIIEAMQNS